MDKGFSLQDILLPYQKKFILDDRKKKIWLASRQVGKSFALSYIATLKALEFTNSLVLVISTGARASGEFLKKCIQMAEAVHTLTDKMVTYSNTSDTITFNTGGRILSLPSGNPSALRGYTASTIIIDECAFIERPEQVFSAIAPTLTRNKNANLIVASTPAGKNNFFHKLYTEADDDWYVQTTTITDAVKDGLKVDIEELKATVKDPEVFEQEYMCRFSNEYSAMVDTEQLDWYEDLPDKTTIRSLLGMDVGACSDRTALVTVLEIEDVMYVDDIVVMHKAEYEHQLKILSELHQKNNYHAGKIDQNGIGSALAEFATKTVSTKITGYTWTSSNKTPAYENLRARIFDHKIRFNKKFKDIIISDFSNVRRIVSESGKVSYEAGRGRNGHSDVTSALVLALEASPKKVTVRNELPIAMIRNSIFGNRISRL